jgi:hypothetical protein
MSALEPRRLLQRNIYPDDDACPPDHTLVSPLAKTHAVNATGSHPNIHWGTSPTDADRAGGAVENAAVTNEAVES